MTLFQVQITHSMQLPKPRPGQLGVSKSGELLLSIFICFMCFHIWADTSSRNASIVVHTIFMAQGVARSIKKQTHIRTYTYIPPHTQSESKRVLAKGWSFDSMKRMLHAC